MKILLFWNNEKIVVGHFYLYIDIYIQTNIFFSLFRILILIRSTYVT